MRHKISDGQRMNIDCDFEAPTGLHNLARGI